MARCRGLTDAVLANLTLDEAIAVLGATGGFDALTDVITTLARGAVVVRSATGLDFNACLVDAALVIGAVSGAGTFWGCGAGIGVTTTGTAVARGGCASADHSKTTDEIDCLHG